MLGKSLGNLSAWKSLLKSDSKHGRRPILNTIQVTPRRGRVVVVLEFGETGFRWWNRDALEKLNKAPVSRHDDDRLLLWGLVEDKLDKE